MTDPSIFSFPLSLLLAAVLVTGILLSDLRLRSKSIFKVVTGRWTAIVGIMALTVFLIVEGTWGIPMHSHPLFLTVVAAFMYSVGCLAVRSFREHRSWRSRLSHLGIFLVLIGGFFSGADRREGLMKVDSREAVHYAYSPTGRTIPLPFSVTLDRLEIEYYDDGLSPRQYRSHITVDGHSMATEVNSPCSYGGYMIYQSDCDRDDLSFSVLKVVRDPWLPVTYAGMAIMALAAIMSLGSILRGRWSWIAIAIGAVVFTIISIARINFGTLVPALRSMWFVPHLLIYMTAYSMLAISVATGIAYLARPKREALYRLCVSLLDSSSSLLLIGMLCGAVWAKYAWGDYWTWDAKECWAAVTWLLTLLGSHIRVGGSFAPRLKVIVAVVAFSAMQITWYGVNYLPAAERSLHTYNRVA